MNQFPHDPPKLVPGYGRGDKRQFERAGQRNASTDVARRQMGWSRNQIVAFCWAGTLIITAIDWAYVGCGLFLALMLAIEPSPTRSPQEGATPHE
jgi:hypothetical protein